jgi:hypothetical protein
MVAVAVTDGKAAGLRAAGLGEWDTDGVQTVAAALVRPRIANLKRICEGRLTETVGRMYMGL